MKNLLVVRTASSWLWLLAARLWRCNAAKAYCLGACSLLLHFTAYAQPITPPTDFKSWEWETAPYTSGNTYSDAYLRTWRANIQSGSAAFTADMRAPWNNANSDALDLIATNFDYKKSKGWQLVRFDFGGLTAVTVPYFILYHRPTGVLRIYAYIADNTGSYTGSVVTLSHSQNDGTYSGHSAATLSASSATTPAANATGVLQAPDKYRSNSASTYSQEQMTYVSFLNTRQGWTMAQFTLGFDPAINDASAYQMNKYQIQIFGLVSSAVDLKGAFEFTTTKKDFAYGGPPITPTPNSSVSDGQDFQVGTQKYLGGLATVADQVKNIATKADGFVKLSDQSKLTKEVKDAAVLAAKTAELASKATVLTKIAATAGKIGEVAGAFGGVFSLAGTIIGFFTDDASSASTAFIPTTSKGTITLSGTITTKKALHTFMLLTPGTQHYLSSSGSSQTPADSRSQLPFNDCPTGIFNIQNTPVVDYMRSDQWNREKVCCADAAPGSGEMRRLISLNSYLLRNDIKPTLNVSSDLEIQSVRYALAYRVDLSRFTTSHVNYHPTNGYQVADNFPGERDREWNFLYGQVESGEVILQPYDPGKAGDGSDAKVIMQTPFASCAEALYPITVPTELGAPYLRLIATLHVKGTPVDSPPVYYAQDYEVTVVNSSATWPSTTRALNARPVFQVQYDGSYPRPASVYAPDLTKTGALVYDDYTAGQEGEVAFATLLFDANSAVTLRGGQNNRNIVFQASRSVGFTGTLAIPSGFSVAITTDPTPLYYPGGYTCSATQLQYNQVNIPCTQNGQALRTEQTLATKASTEAELATLSLAPNPATGTTVAHLKVAGSETIQQVEVVNVQGQILWKKVCHNVQELNEAIPLGELRLGVYVVRVTTSTSLYTNKLAVQ